MKCSVMLALGAALWIVSGTVSARADCNSKLNGTYGWLVEKGLIAAGATAGPTIGDFTPFSTVGVLTFDGSGGVTGKHFTNFGGTFVTFANDSGTYTVNNDCTTGMIALVHEVTLSFDLVAGGQEIAFTSATNGRVFSGLMRPVASECALSGSTYTYATTGLMGASLVGSGFPRIGGYVPFSNTGHISFAGTTITGAHDANLGGVFTPGITDAGNYSVASDCVGTVGFNNGTWYFVVVEGATQIIFVSNQKGVIWSGLLHRN